MGIREELHDALDGQAFSSEAILARVATQLDSSRRTHNDRLAVAIAVMLTVALVATLFAARAVRDANHEAPNSVGAASKCVPDLKRSSISGGRPHITEYAVPADLTGLGSITAGADGNLWLVGYAGVAPNILIVKLTTSGTFAEYRVPTANTYIGGITAGPDGNLWFTQNPLATSAAPASGARQSRPGHVDTAKVVRLTTSGSFTEYAVPTIGDKLGGITTGPDCNLWVADSGANAIMKMTTSGNVTEYAIPSPDSYPSAITAGPDGALWFTEAGKGKIGETGKVGRVTILGAITEFPLPPSGSSWGYRPTGIAAGPDGNLWITEYGNWPGGGPGRVAKLTTSGAFTEYNVPTTKLAPGLSLMRDMGPNYLAAGPDGKLWFSNFWNLDSVTTKGIFSQYVIPAPEGHFSQVYAIAAGPDGALWFTGSILFDESNSTTQRPLVGKMTFTPER